MSDQRSSSIAPVKDAPRTGMRSVAQVLVENLEAQGVKYVFGIPGAKIDKVFDALNDSSQIKTIVCRHEQNAAFIAGGIGRLTGKAGVVLVTSGPGCSNLVTGLMTANTEGDPIVALGGAVPLVERLKQTHQSVDTVNLFRPVTKFSAEVDSPHTISEVFAQAFRSAESHRPGAAFISLPSDIINASTDAETMAPINPVMLGSAAQRSIEKAAQLINEATKPILLLGLLASQPNNAQAIKELLGKSKIAVVSSFQAAGVISRDLLACFAGRVGLFHNQPADEILDQSDLVVTIGYDPVEYDPILWNHKRERPLIHIDTLACDADEDYRPQIELVGDIAATLSELKVLLQPRESTGHEQLMQKIAEERTQLSVLAAKKNGYPVHPLRIVHELQEILSDDVTLCVDVGSFYIWIARYLYSFRARQILTSNGQQTLGVGLPWAIAASLARPGDKVISVSGDGGFLFSAMELETAVRLKCNLVHIVWIDGTYNMVEFQAVSKYGRAAAVEFGPVDIVEYARAFGAHGFHIHSADDLRPTLRQAMALEGPVLIGIQVDYSENMRLMEALHPHIII